MNVGATDSSVESPGPPPTMRFAVFDSVVSWILGVSLLLSCIPHLSNPYFFLGSVYSYGLVGPRAGQLVAMALPFLQLVLAGCLIANLFRSTAHLLTVTMLFVFAAVQTSVKVRGMDIPCGCFGPRHETVIGWFTLSTVYGLLVLAALRLIGSLSLSRKPS